MLCFSHPCGSFRFLYPARMLTSDRAHPLALLSSSQVFIVFRQYFLRFCLELVTCIDVPCRLGLAGRCSMCVSAWFGCNVSKEWWRTNVVSRQPSAMRGGGGETSYKVVVCEQSECFGGVILLSSVVWYYTCVKYVFPMKPLSLLWCGLWVALNDDDIAF